jgi:hypothetical protein
LPNRPYKLPVYGRNQEILFISEGEEQHTHLLECGLVREVGSKRKTHALYWIGQSADESELVSLRIPVGTKTVYREPVGDRHVWAHRQRVCDAWGCDA